MLQPVLAAAAFIPMVVEAALSSRNERTLRAAGATEPAEDVFAAMRLAYPLFFAAMIAESYLLQHVAPITLPAGIAVFVGAKALKYWAIATLGVRWTFRVLVPPRSARIVEGPYRFVRHPNYAGVIGEIAGFALMAGAAASGVASLVLYIALMRARIRVEERALGLR